jgi:hypothetical protein
MTQFLFFWCVLISAQLYSFWYQKVRVLTTWACFE